MEELVTDRIVSIWQREFVNESIGPDDDFFDLGGDSLLALELVGMVEEEFGIEVPASSLLSATTPRALAGFLAGSAAVGSERVLEQAAAEEWPPFLVALSGSPAGASRSRKGEAPSPLVCFHAIDGGAMFYRDWTLDLAAGDREVVGIESPLLHGQPLEEVCLEALAGRYLDAVEQTFPDAPLVLCGYSFGALTACETARQAELRGIPVAALVMIDMFNPAGARMRSTRERLHSVWRESRGKPAFARCGAVLAKVGSLGRALGHAAGGALSERLPSAPKALKRRGLARKRHLEMVRRYRPEPVRARTLLVMTREPWDKFDYADDWRGWRETLVGEASTCLIEGNHLQVFESENLERLSATVRAFCAATAPKDEAFGGGGSDPVNAKALVGD